jgi:hypothetical protein
MIRLEAVVYGFCSIYSASSNDRIRRSGKSGLGRLSQLRNLSSCSAFPLRAAPAEGFFQSKRSANRQKIGPISPTPKLGGVF